VSGTFFDELCLIMTGTVIDNLLSIRRSLRLLSGLKAKSGQVYWIKTDILFFRAYSCFFVVLGALRGHFNLPFMIYDLRFLFICVIREIRG
jgi:hypothetical protein